MHIDVSNKRENTMNEELMEKSEMVSIAKMAIYKNYDYELLRYCDDLYGKEKFVDDVWDLVIECREMGTRAFNVKYPD